MLERKNESWYKASQKYYKPPRDLSIHTHDQCRVPAFSKRSNNGNGKIFNKTKN